MPENSAEDAEQLRDLGSPIGKFVRERCEISPEFFEPSDNLWKSWKNFCEEEEIHNTGTKVHFFRNLNSFVTVSKRIKKMDKNGKQFACYTGIKLDFLIDSGDDF